MCRADKTGVIVTKLKLTKSRITSNTDQGSSSGGSKLALRVEESKLDREDPIAYSGIKRCRKTKQAGEKFKAEHLHTQQEK